MRLSNALRYLVLAMIAVLPAYTCGRAATDDVNGEILTVPSVTVLIGLPGVDLRSVGALTIGHSGIRFASEQQAFEIRRSRILHVAIGDEVIETGGTGGRIIRMVIPYGGGQAVGAVTHKRVQLLTVEFRDDEGAYHGVVFMLGTDDIENVRRQLSNEIKQRVEMPKQANVCLAQALPNGFVRVNPIRVGGMEILPDEDRVLLYEYLVQKLSAQKDVAWVLRAGDDGPSVQCAEMTLTLRVDMFKKGNQAVRAASGPLGHFIGTTSLHYHVTLESQGGRTLIDRDMGKSVGTDTDSLNITKAVAKVVSRAVEKARSHVDEPQGED